ncbi:Calcium-binding protein [Frankia sp. AiPs1]|uniref:EF-hand domain-containing protein n=1 Tax=Frankia sp. AiPa1 TaxID=573492 RepID=UPI00202AEBF4|nr:EF-hand domain-containing protein [Frankia sp. AiPa1]MCL9758126.1 EF-hand domain-containing protein [Frankia sp. AiPa1]
MASTQTKPQDVRLEKLFQAVDANNDGVIDWSDYERILDRYFSGFELDKNSYEARALWAAHQHYWYELLRHSDSRDRLNKDDFIQAIRLLTLDTSRFNLVEGLPHAVFDIIDRNGDGAISKDEFGRYLEVWEIDPKNGLEVFDRIDSDGDGTISRHEFLRSWREFYYTPDWEAPGARYFGVE